MNRSMMAGIGIGIASALALSAAASGSLFTPQPTFAEVIASKPITETIKTPRQECRNVTVTHRKPVQDEHKILGTVVGAALGGVVGHQFGGGSGKKVATAAGAVAGGYAGNQVQGNMQAGDTYTKRVNPSGKMGGTLRRGWTSATHEEAASGKGRGDAKAYADSLQINHKGNLLTIDIVNPVEYASYVEYGHRTANHTGWVQGQFMLTISEQEIQTIAPQVLEAKIKQFLGECIK